MIFYEALETAAAAAGLSLGQVGDKLGKTRAYVSNAKQRGSDPSTANAAAMLGACGWTLCAMPADKVPPDALTLDAAPVTDADRAAAVERKRAALLRQLDELDQRGGLLG